MIRTTIIVLATAWVVVDGPSPTPAHTQERAETHELTRLLAIADTANAEIATARHAANAALARVPQAGALPDPTLGVGFMNVPVAEPGLRGDMMTMMQIQLGARLLWPGKLSVAEDVARLRAEAAAWEVQRVRDRVAAEVEVAYYRIFFVERALEVTRRNETVLGDFAELTSTRYGVGVGGQSDVLKAQVERTRLTEQVIGLEERREAELARLEALLGGPMDAVLAADELPERVRMAATVGARDGPRFESSALSDLFPGDLAEGDPSITAGAGSRVAGTLPTVADLQALALDHSPMIQAELRRIAAQERSVALARKASLPDFAVTAGYSRRAGLSDFFNVMVSAPVPIFAGRKQSQGVVEQSAVLDERRARHREMVDGLNAEIASLVAELRRAREQIVLLDAGILPQARAGLSSTTSAYRVGGVDFLSLLDAQVTLYRHELDQHRLVTDFAQNLAALERAVGTEVLR